MIMLLNMAKGQLSWWAKSNHMNPLKQSFLSLVVDREVRGVPRLKEIPCAVVSFVASPARTREIQELREPTGQQLGNGTSDL